MNLANDFHALANRLARLAPSHRDPFRFHEEKSELVHELHMLANAVADALGRIAANDNIKGFAPGHYMCICNECGKRFAGAKHSWRCELCEPPGVGRRREVPAPTTSKMEVVKESLTTEPMQKVHELRGA